MVVGLLAVRGICPYCSPTAAAAAAAATTITESATCVDTTIAHKYITHIAARALTQPPPTSAAAHC